jgi:N-acyl-D-aspartate/D-glutamate deacylase
MAARPDYEPMLDRCLAAEASRANEPVLPHIYDALLADDGKALLYFPVYNYTGMNLDVVREMLMHPRALLGLGDGGAHVGAICDASIETYMLTHWVRDRTRGERLPVELVIRKMTADTASLYGLGDRGTLEVGMKGDVNVIDLDRLQLHRPTMEYDLPGGARRLLQRADGYVATIVSGAVVVREGEATGALPGKLIRGAR